MTLTTDTRPDLARLEHELNPHAASACADDRADAVATLLECRAQELAMLQQLVDELLDGQPRQHAPTVPDTGTRLRHPAGRRYSPPTAAQPPAEPTQRRPRGHLREPRRGWRIA